MEFSSEFWVQILIYAVTFAAAWGSMNARIRFLEQKVDRHNNMVERLAVAENKLSAVNHRINEIKEEMEHERNPG